MVDNVWSETECKYSWPAEPSILKKVPFLYLATSTGRCFFPAPHRKWSRCQSCLFYLFWYKYSANFVLNFRSNYFEEKTDKEFLKHCWHHSLTLFNLDEGEGGGPGNFIIILISLDLGLRLITKMGLDTHHPPQTFRPETNRGWSL